MFGHSFDCYLRMARAQARSQMQYRFNFFAMMVAMMLTYAGQFVSLWFLTARFRDIDGWRLDELVLLYALAIVAWGVCIGIFNNLQGFEDQIRSGTFDRALLRPMNPLLHVLGSQSPIAGIGQLLFAILAFIFAFSTSGVGFTPVNAIYLLLTALGGGMILGAAMVTVASVAFWTTRTYVFYWGLVFPARQLINYPVSIYSRWLQLLLTAVVPFAFINYYPAHVLLGQTGRLAFPPVAWATPLVGVVSLAAAYRLWSWGTRFYTGTGS